MKSRDAAVSDANEKPETLASEEYCSRRSENLNYASGIVLSLWMAIPEDDHPQPLHERSSRESREPSRFVMNLAIFRFR